ncbi:putative Polyhydroxyalkanoate synthesis repressor PhaR [Legionella birminghamensis]|uniref:Polyhydroxyalkanoate synthesis repressor PhaR n=1 Tax=Legionella birminghamensis TaxID=28083 RepID=A0A378I7E3_9GAMM|nr:polyhydroxyalkanoate synthesis regulator DNA-binding domain-containing protein [Legionella birminghamensis]KTC72419.1 putative Polyhydroxyalkanoate synthesis repressor PhaR [Legionella birminghamensis]STX30551.1 putative Polyhydroxyalkanoate synthesis repressor PhaR [Legionella birminghamensis]
MSRLIKKYKNRRLYDMEKSKYITVEELQQYVIDGIPFRVEDSTTNQDITNSTLLQIFIEMENGTTQFLSPEVLRQLIILSKHPMHQLFANMLDQFFNNMANSLKANPYLSNAPQSHLSWQQQMQQIAMQWQNLFKT